MIALALLITLAAGAAFTALILAPAAVFGFLWERIRQTFSRNP